MFIHSSLHERGGNRDSQSRIQKLQIIKQYSPETVVRKDDTRGFSKPRLVFVGRGGVNLYFYHLGTAANVFRMEDIDNSWS